MKTKVTLLAAGLLGVLLFWTAPVSALSITDSDQYTPGVLIRDNDLNGVADTHTFNSTIQSIASLEVTLNIAGGYNGDLYAYLRHGNSGFAVLLNHVGSTPNNPLGSMDTGFDITLSDGAPGNVHDASAGGGTLTGVWQPDGRNVSPLAAISAVPQSATLDSFNGMNPNGDWTLFIADTSPIGAGTLTSWGIQVTGNRNPVPDGGNTLLLLGLAFGVAFVLQHRLSRARR